MDVTDQLQAYTSQIVALGRATLARQRRGEWLPDELVGPAEALLALERALGATPADEIATAVEEPSAPAGWLSPAGEVPVEELTRSSVPDEQPQVEPIATMSPIEADDWLTSLENEPDGLLILPTFEADDETHDYLVIDVEEEAGAADSGALATNEPAPEPASELRFCANCGAELRPGRHFCYRCGAAVAS